MTVVERVERGCGCQLTTMFDGNVILQRCSASRGVHPANRATPDCELGDDVWNDLDTFIRPLQDLFRFGGSLRHEP